MLCCQLVVFSQDEEKLSVWLSPNKLECSKIKKNNCRRQTEEGYKRDTGLCWPSRPHLSPYPIEDGEVREEFWASLYILNVLLPSVQLLPSSAAPQSAAVGTLTGWGPELRSALQFLQESKGSHPNRDHLKVVQEAAKVVILCSLKGKML